MLLKILFFFLFFTDSIKKIIASALIEMPKTRFWGERLAKFGIQNFVSNSPDNYDFGKEILDNAKEAGIGIRYY